MFIEKLILGITSTALLLSVSTAAQARVTDAVGDFLQSYIDARPNPSDIATQGDLDVVSTNVTFDGVKFDLTTTLAGAVGTTPNAIYVFGFDRGQGTPRFNIAPLNLSGVLFDSVVILRLNLTVTINRIVGGTATNLGVGSATFTGNTIPARIAATELPSLGLSPNNSNAAVVVVPEANTALLLAPALCTLGVVVIRRRIAKIA